MLFGGSLPALTTRSFMVLGLLNLRDWTSYELAAQMQRGFADIWENSRSMVFQEPKHLVAQGLASAEVEQVGKRSRTRYRITDAGRSALRDWLAQPGAAPAMHFEGLLKVLLTDTADPAPALTSLAAAREWAAETRETGRAVARDYTADAGPFPDRIRVVSLAFAFLWDFADLVDRWAAWAQRESGNWPDGDPFAPFKRALTDQPAISD
jgi:DNA-binding PadR family transcriptional regulator